MNHVTATHAQSARATEARALVQDLQQRFVNALQSVSERQGAPVRFEPISWLRDEGRHGGGVRYTAADTPIFNRASVNVSHVHYDDTPDKRLASATALSTIIHPAHPHASSVHMHVSWTEMRDGSGYWRVMADLNPAIAESAPREAFATCLREAAPAQFDEAAEQGDRYFHIPSLQRHRGVVHFYLEGYRTDDAAADAALARGVIEAGIDTYAEQLHRTLTAHSEPDAAAIARQLHYHTTYLLQVLTLDRGTTSGLLVHDQNDVGILGSLPSHVDRELLNRWGAKQMPPQDQLVAKLVDALVPEQPSPVTVKVKRALAQVVRAHYRQHPEALSMQASGNIVPPTVANHR